MIAIHMKKSMFILFIFLIDILVCIYNMVGMDTNYKAVKFVTNGDIKKGHYFYDVTLPQLRACDINEIVAVIRY